MVQIFFFRDTQALMLHFTCVLYLLCDGLYFDIWFILTPVLWGDGISIIHSICVH